MNRDRPGQGYVAQLLVLLLAVAACNVTACDTAPAARSCESRLKLDGGEMRYRAVTPDIRGCKSPKFRLERGQTVNLTYDVKPEAGSVLLTLESPGSTHLRLRLNEPESKTVTAPIDAGSNYELVLEGSGFAGMIEIKWDVK